MENSDLPLNNQNNEMPQTQSPSVDPPVRYQPMPYEVQKKPNRVTNRFKFWLLLPILAVFIVIFWILFNSKIPKNENNNPPLPVKSPTPAVGSLNTNVYPMATSSAFLEIENSINSLGASISAYSAQDPSLSPPTIELSLGFSY